MEIIPDPIHAALLMLPFAVAAVTLNLVLWRPLLAYLDERKATVERADHEAHDLEHAATEQIARIEEKLAAARAEISSTRQAARQRALLEEGRIVAEARAQADQRVTEALEEIRRDRAAASAVLRSTSGDLSGQIAAQVLGRPVA